MHSLLQPALQSTLQSKLPPEHLALQPPSQLALQLASMLALHLPSQAAVKWMGVQLAVQPPDTSTLHEALASTLMLPQDDRSPGSSSPPAQPDESANSPTTSIVASRYETYRRIETSPSRKWHGIVANFSGAKQKAPVRSGHQYLANSPISTLFSVKGV